MYGLLNFSTLQIQKLSEKNFLEPVILGDRRESGGRTQVVRERRDRGWCCEGCGLAADCESQSQLLDLGQQRLRGWCVARRCCLLHALRGDAFDLMGGFFQLFFYSKCFSFRRWKEILGL